jgi:hypothetical protein
MSLMSESRWWHLFHKEWRAETLQRGLEFDNFKPGLESGIFKCISWLNGSFFGCDDRGFLKEVVETYLMAPMSPLNSPTFFRSSHIYSLCFEHSTLTKGLLFTSCHNSAVCLILFFITYCKSHSRPSRVATYCKIYTPCHRPARTFVAKLFTRIL